MIRKPGSEPAAPAPARLGPATPQICWQLTTIPPPHDSHRRHCLTQFNRSGAKQTSREVSPEGELATWEFRPSLRPQPEQHPSSPHAHIHLCTSEMQLVMGFLLLSRKSDTKPIPRLPSRPGGRLVRREPELKRSRSPDDPPFRAARYNTRCAEFRGLKGNDARIRLSDARVPPPRGIVRFLNRGPTPN